MGYILLLTLPLFGKIFNTVMVKYFTGGDFLPSFFDARISGKAEIRGFLIKTVSA